MTEGMYSNMITNLSFSYTDNDELKGKIKATNIPLIQTWDISKRGYRWAGTISDGVLLSDFWSHNYKLIESYPNYIEITITGRYEDN